MTKFTLDGEEINLDERTFTNSGCFNKEGEIDGMQTHKDIIRYLKTFNDDDVFLDCGANVGIMSLWIQKGRAIAYEAVESTFQIMKENMKLNPEKNIEAYNFGLYDSVVHYRVVKNEAEPGRSEIVGNESSPLETIIPDEDLKIRLQQEENVKLIKIDCESTTRHVLLGILGIIRKYRPIVIIEGRIDEIMVPMGYKAVGGADGNTIYEPKPEPKPEALEGLK